MADSRNKDLVVLFDFDGVISDTEGLYTEFWDVEGRKYFAEEDFGMKIKGQTFKHLSGYFKSDEDRIRVMNDIDEFERNMPYDLIPGALDFLKHLEEQRRQMASGTLDQRDFDQILSASANGSASDLHIYFSQKIPVSPRKRPVVPRSANQLA